MVYPFEKPFVFSERNTSCSKPWIFYYLQSKHDYDLLISWGLKTKAMYISGGVDDIWNNINLNSYADTQFDFDIIKQLPKKISWGMKISRKLSKFEVLFSW